MWSCRAKMYICIHCCKKKLIVFVFMTIFFLILWDCYDWFVMWPLCYFVPCKSRRTVGHTLDSYSELHLNVIDQSINCYHSRRQLTRVEDFLRPSNSIDCNAFCSDITNRRQRQAQVVSYFVFVLLCGHIFCGNLTGGMIATPAQVKMKLCFISFCVSTILDICTNAKKC